jgi:hypothetical protein
MGSLAIIMSAKDYAESVKEEEKQRLEKLDMTLSSGCIDKWPLKKDYYKECMGNIRKRMYRGDI